MAVAAAAAQTKCLLPYISLQSTCRYLTDRFVRMYWVVSVGISIACAAAATAAAAAAHHILHPTCYVRKKRTKKKGKK